MGYHHPVDLPVEKAGLILHHLVFREDHVFMPSINKYIFTPEEVLAAAKPLTQSLAQISADERLRFLITRSHWSEVFTGVSGTSGVIFSPEEGVLDVALDRIQEHVTGAEEGDPMQVSFREEPTRLLDASPLLPDSGMALHVDSATGKTFPRWLEINIAAIRPPVASQAPPTRPAQSTEAAPAPAAGKAPEPTRSAEEEQRYQRLRERLELLKRLRADGALSEEDYEKEKEKALSGMKKE